MVGKDLLTLSVSGKGEGTLEFHSDSTKHVLSILLEFSGALETPATETVFHFEAFLLLLVPGLAVA